MKMLACEKAMTLSMQLVIISPCSCVVWAGERLIKVKECDYGGWLCGSQHFKKVKASEEREEKIKFILKSTRGRVGLT